MSGRSKIYSDEWEFLQTNSLRRVRESSRKFYNIINIYILRSNKNNLLLIALLFGKGRYPLDNSPSPLPEKKTFLNCACVCTCMTTNHVLVIWSNSLLQLNSKRSKILLIISVNCVMHTAYYINYTWKEKKNLQN